MAPQVPASRAGTRPDVRFLVHGAERSGPPRYVLTLLTAWTACPPAFRPSVVVARPGPLVPAFERVAPTTVARLDRRSPEQVGARALRAARMDGAAAHLADAATRRRVGDDVPALTVVNGATAPTCALLRALPHGRVVMVAHELSTGWFGNIDDADRSLLLSTCERYLAVSEPVRDLLIDRLGVPSEVVEVVPPAIDLSERRAAGRGSGDGPVVVIGSGETDWRKAPELWLQAAALVRSMAPDLDIRFRWFGGATTSEPAAWPLRHEVDHLALGDRVEFLGPVPSPWPVLAGADLYATAAREDAAPMACSEAAAAGLPVVTFDVGGAADLVRDGRCGRVIPYPLVTEFAGAVVELARDPELRSEMGRRGAAHVEARQEAGVVAGRVEAWLMGSLT